MAVPMFIVRPPGFIVFVIFSAVSCCSVSVHTHTLKAETLAGFSFPGVDFKANSPQRQELHLRLCRIQLACYMSKFMTVQLVQLEGLPGESFSLKVAWQHGLGSHRCTEQTGSCLERCPFEQRRLKWRCLDIMHRATFGKTQTAYQCCQAGGGRMMIGSCLQPQDRGIALNHELVCTPKCSVVSCDLSNS